MKINWNNSMKTQHIKIIALFVLIALIVVSCNNQNEHATHDQYTCPMHPTVIQDKPGSCPICGMDLVRKGQPGEEVKITAELSYLLKPTNAMVVSSIKTILPVEKSVDVISKINGTIAYDTRRFAEVPIRFSGRIEKLFVRYNFQSVRKGQKILEIYSPDLATAQRELLYLLKSDGDNAALIEKAKDKLKLLGVSDSQISELITSGKESYSFAVYSPVDGYVMETRNGSETSASSKSGGMGESSEKSSEKESYSTEKSELQTRAGMYLNAGESIFKIVNTENVWAEFDVPQKEASALKVNYPVTIEMNESESAEAKLDFVQPFFANGESFVKVRVYLKNSYNQYRVGQLVNASFNKPSSKSIWIPQSAVLDLGTKQVVFIKRQGIFRPKSVVVFKKSYDWTGVTGLESTDSIAYNAQFMMDSESFIKVKI